MKKWRRILLKNERIKPFSVNLFDIELTRKGCKFMGLFDIFKKKARQPAAPAIDIMVNVTITSSTKNFCKYMQSLSFRMIIRLPQLRRVSYQLL
jgi:hypothetical protein